MEGYVGEKGVTGLYAKALDAAGTAQSKYSLYMQGTQAQIDRLRASWEGLWMSAVKSSDIQSIVKGLNGITSSLKSVVDHIGLFPPILAVAGTAIIAFNGGFNAIKATGVALLGVLKGVPVGLTSLEASLAASALKTNILTGATRALTVSLEGLKVAGTFLVGALLPLAAFTVIGIAIEKVTEAIQKQREEEQKIKQSQDDVVKSYSAHSEKIKQLASDYTSLSAKVKSGQLDSSSKDYVDTMNQLGKLMPSLVQSTDEHGNSILRSVDAVKDELNYAKQLKDTYDKMAVDNFEKDLDSESKKVDDILKKIKGYNQSKMGLGQYDSPVNPNVDAGKKDYYDTQIIGQERELQLLLANSNKYMSEKAKAMMDVEGISSKLSDSNQKLVNSYINEAIASKKTVKDGEDFKNFLSDTINHAVSLAEALSHIPKQLDGMFTNKQATGMSKDQVAVMNSISEEVKSGYANWDNYKEVLLKVGFNSDLVTRIIAKLKTSTKDNTDATKQASDANAKYVDDLNKTIDAEMAKATAEEQIVGTTQKLIDQSKDLITTYQLLSNMEYLSADQKDALAEATAKLNALYPQFIENGKLNVEKMRKEAEAEDILLKAVNDVKDGHAKAEEVMTTNQALQSKARLKMIADEIASYEKVMDAIATASEQDGMSTAKSRAYHDSSNKIADLKSQMDAITKSYDGQIQSLSNLTGYQGQYYDSTDKSSYVSDKYKLAIDAVNLELEKQKKLQDQYPKTSQQYQNALKAEVSLLDQKKKLLQDQSKSLASQIASGKIQQTGKVNSSSTTSFASGGSTSDQIWNFFKSQGLSDSAVAGIMGNLQLESGLSTTATNKSSGAYGLAQWLGGRKTALNNYAKSKGTSSSDLQTQLEYLWKELTGSESKTLNYLQSNPNASASTTAQMFDKLFERSEGTSVASRQKYANQIMSQYSGKGVTGSSADNAQKIDEAKSQLLQLQQDIMDIDNQIQELNLALVQSVAAEQDRKVNSYRDDMAKLDAQQSKVDQLSQSWRDLEAERLRELNKQKEYSQQAIDYLNEQYRVNTKLTSAQKATIAEDVLDRTKALYELQQTINDTEQKIAQSKFDEFLKNVKNAYDDASTRLDDINKKMDMAATESDRAKYLKDEIALMKERQRLAVDNILKLRQERVEMSAFPDIVSSIDEEIKTWTDNSKQITVDLNNAYSQLADNIVSIYKDMYSQEKDMALKNIDDELNAYKKATDDRLKLIDKQENDNGYNKDLASRQKELQDIQKQIDKLRLDDSLGAKAKLDDLLKQQADKQLELEDFMYQRQVDLQKQALEDDVTAKEDAANQQKDQMTKYYDDLINSERNFANMREQIMQGNISSLQIDLQNFATFVQQNMATIGQSISENLLDKLATAGISLSSLNGNGVTFNTPSSVMHNLLGFDTGGFTGNGQGIAMLHEKELILNKDDTSNFLAGIKILRPIVDFLKNPRLPKLTPAIPTGSLPPISINIENLSVAGGKQGADDFLNYINNKFAARGLNTRV